MTNRSLFRGLAGVVLAGFLRPGTFITMIPVAIVGLLGSLLISVLHSSVPSIVQILVPTDFQNLII